MAQTLHYVHYRGDGETLLLDTGGLNRRTVGWQGGDKEAAQRRFYPLSLIATLGTIRSWKEAFADHTGFVWNAAESNDPQMTQAHFLASYEKHEYLAPEDSSMYEVQRLLFEEYFDPRPWAHEIQLQHGEHSRYRLTIARAADSSLVGLGDHECEVVNDEPAN